MHTLTYLLQQHGGKIATAAVALYVALVTSLPEKREDFHWYDYFYAVTHALIPIRMGGQKPNA